MAQPNHLAWLRPTRLECSHATGGSGFLREALLTADLDLFVVLHSRSGQTTLPSYQNVQSMVSYSHCKVPMSPHRWYTNISDSNIHHSIIKSAPVLTKNKTTKMFLMSFVMKNIRLQIHMPTPVYLQWLDITWYYLMSQHEVKKISS